MLVFPFAGEDYVLCSRLSSSNWFQDDGFQIFGSHLDIDVKYEQSAPTIVPRRDASSVAAACGSVSFERRIALSVSNMVKRSLLEWGHRSLRAEETEFSFGDVVNAITGDDDSTCKCKGKRRACVFVAGLKSYKDYGLTDDDPANYFGDSIADHAPSSNTSHWRRR